MVVPCFRRNDNLAENNFSAKAEIRFPAEARFMPVSSNKADV